MRQYPRKFDFWMKVSIVPIMTPLFTASLQSYEIVVFPAHAGAVS
jgi:hypothetical protein